MDHYTHAVRRQYWIDQIRQCNESGMKKTEWIKQNGLCEKSFYYWQRKLRMDLALDGSQKNLSVSAVSSPSESPVFVQISDTCSTAGSSVPSAVIRCGHAQIEISDSISDDLLLRLLKAAANA